MFVLVYKKRNNIKLEVIKKGHEKVEAWAFVLRLRSQCSGRCADTRMPMTSVRLGKVLRLNVIEPWMTNLSGSRVSAFSTTRVACSSFWIFRLSAKSHAMVVDD